ncbi:hypothetical protein [Streptomyces azureus]|uniref:Putative transposase n=1 Tax=Streptomyces azureus TaxID=146537 RepID=A0A0K8PGQ8_STRAJ|nr:hypothetical protein [Streptomyces azureus]GAP46893.1 putative transposase [Streptomyces azureus]
MEPTIYGMELVLGMEIEDGVPDCHGEEMKDEGTDRYGDRTYTCRTCGTVIEVDDLGLVDAIREKAAS